MEETPAMREEIAFLQSMCDLSVLAQRWAKRKILQRYGALWL